MIFQEKIFRYSLLLLLVTLLLGCHDLGNSGIAQPNQNNTTSINEIKQNSANSTAPVYLKGKVINIAPFLDKGAYQIEDNTGTIWILTAESLPKQGEEILLQGEIKYESIPIGNQDLGEIYLVELKKLNVEATNPKPSNNTSNPSNVEATNPKPSNNTPNPSNVEVTNPKPSNSTPNTSINDLFLPHKQLNK